MKNQALLLLFSVLHFACSAQEAKIEVDSAHVLHRVTPYLTGACIEDVNHEVYGGIDSQMIFGESFAEPAPPVPLNGFTTFGGDWAVTNDVLYAPAGNGPKIVLDTAPFTNGEAAVEILFPSNKGGNAGLIVKASDPGKGTDQFNGYEISLESAGMLVLGRHRQNWEPIRRLPCDLPPNQWFTLTVRMTANSLEVSVNGKSITTYEDKEHPLESGTVGLRTWQREAQFRNLTITTAAPRRVPFKQTSSAEAYGISGMWRAVRTGSTAGKFGLVTTDTFSGNQSQLVTHTGGAGQVGIENQGLNRQGMNFVTGKSYEGFVYARAAEPMDFVVGLESSDGQTIYAEKHVKVSRSEWQRLDFELKARTADTHGRFVIKLKQPGSIVVGYAFLQPGKWGRYKGLPVRKDVAEGLVEQGITVLRLGGNMVNASEYHWKKMTGPRERRPPYAGWWYPHSSNGWAIPDFLNFCEIAGFLAVPDVNLDETPQDIADLLEYANGRADSTWGRRRVADGHKKPYHLHYLEIGNEERVNEEYWHKFKAIAEAVWAKDPQLILVVGDFAYGRTIEDPFNFTGAAGRITTLEAHRKILQLAKQHDREVWFDVHVDTEGPRPNFGGTFSYVDALDRIADGAKHRVVIFEFNAGNHSQRRALANAAAINAVERDGRISIATSANSLQPDGQNDNGWDQGLLFLNPQRVWLQPPGYVTRMFARSYEPLVVKCGVDQNRPNLDVSATRNENGKTLVLQVVNFSDEPQPASLDLRGFKPSKLDAHVQELAAPLMAANTAQAPDTIVVRQSHWRHEWQGGKLSYIFPANSVSIIKFR